MNSKLNDRLLDSIMLPSISSAMFNNKKSKLNNLQKHKVIDFTNDVKSGILVGGFQSETSSKKSELDSQKSTETLSRASGNTQHSGSSGERNTESSSLNSLFTSENNMSDSSQLVVAIENTDLASNSYIAPNLLKGGNVSPDNIYSSDASELLKKITIRSKKNTESDSQSSDDIDTQSNEKKTKQHGGKNKTKKPNSDKKKIKKENKKENKKESNMISSLHRETLVESVSQQRIENSSSQYKGINSSKNSYDAVSLGKDYNLSGLINSDS
jgi:hypothetical protein